MKVLLISGFGLSFKNSEYLRGTLFDAEAALQLKQSYYYSEDGGFNLFDLKYKYKGKTVSLLRPRIGTIPNLTSYTLQSILRRNNIDFDWLPLERLWLDEEDIKIGEFSVVCLSTTFIVNFQTLRYVIHWIRERTSATLILGGQYSNLKYRQILQNYSVDFIVTGDGEFALPALIKALEKSDSVDTIPNLVFKRGDNSIYQTEIHYINLDDYPSPDFKGKWNIIPYESMRGCPFRCKYCSYPSASPQWRFKSANKIYNDWQRYKYENGASHIKAMDSTFTVPPKRLHRLLNILPTLDLTWEAYTRANIIKNREIVSALENANCQELSIGFESMSDVVLGFMNKGVSVNANHRAMQLLKDSNINLRASFMIGYPGETPEEHEKTRSFILNEMSGYCMLSVFSFTDETMPVWNDVDRFKVEIVDPENPEYEWKHCGMNSKVAKILLNETLDEIRWKTDDAVLLLWQADYQRPLLPHLSIPINMRIEKLIERLAMLPRDFPDPSQGKLLINCILNELKQFDIFPQRLME